MAEQTLRRWRRLSTIFGWRLDVAQAALHEAQQVESKLRARQAALLRAPMIGAADAAAPVWREQQAAFTTTMRAQAQALRQPIVTAGAVRQERLAVVQAAHRRQRQMDTLAKRAALAARRERLRREDDERLEWVLRRHHSQAATNAPVAIGNAGI